MERIRPGATTTAATSGRCGWTTNRSDNNKQQILVPTKTGKEPVKKLYPKEKNPEQQSHHQGPNQQMGRYPLPQGQPVHLAVAAVPMQFTGGQFSTQPLSLPVYPVQLTAAPIAWARYPEMSLADQQQLQLQAQWAHAAHVSAIQSAVGSPGVQGGNTVSGARGRSRDRARLDPEQRRRAQSKSPARRPNSLSTLGGQHRKSELISGDISLTMAGMNSSAPMSSSGNSSSSKGLSRKFRDFSEAIKQKMSRKSHSGTPVMLSSPNLYQGQGDSVDSPAQPVALKSNLKKQSSSSMLDDHFSNANGGSNGAGSSQNSSHNGLSHGTPSSGDNKKVHFNKFATVQMME